MSQRWLWGALLGLLALGLALSSSWVQAAPVAQEPSPTATRPTPPPLPTVTPAPTVAPPLTTAPVATAEPPTATASPMLLPVSGGAAHLWGAGWLLLVGLGLVGIGRRCRR